MDERREPPRCNVCETTYWRNAKPCVSVLPVKNGKVLLGRRGQDPYKGAIDIIGGFMEVDESPEAGALREGKEETGLDMKIISLLGVYPDRYGEGGDYTLNLHYITEVIGGEMRAMDDIASLEWVDITSVPLDEGFQNTKDGLRDLQEWFENKANQYR